MTKRNNKNSFPHKAVLFVTLLATGLVLGLYVIGQNTHYSQQAAEPSNLNSGLNIIESNNPDGTMGPETWKNNFSSTLQRSSLGTLAVKIINSQSDTNNTNTIEDRMSSGRAINVSSLSITLNKAEVHLTQLINAGTDKKIGNDGKWETLILNKSTKPIDLIQLVKNGAQELGITQLAPGNYTDIRLYIESAAAFGKDGKEIPLTITGRANTIRIIQPFTIKEGQTTTITIDFDANKSVIQAGKINLLTPTVSHFTAI